MATKKKRKTKLRKGNPRLRAINASIRRIAEEDGITFKQARNRYKKSLVEVIYNRPLRKTQKRFLEISPKKFREIPKGKVALDENAVGPVRELGYVQRIRKLHSYWAMVDIYAAEFNLTTAEARAQIKRKGGWEEVRDDVFPKEKDSP